MFSLLKAATPTPSKKSSNIETSTRSRRATATIPVIIFTRVFYSTGAAGTVDEDGPARYDHFAWRQPGSDLDHRVAGPPDTDLAQRQRSIGTYNPDAGRVALVDDRTLRNRRRSCDLAGDDAERDEHIAFQYAIPP